MKKMDDENIKAITFFYPSKAVGGAQYLILRLAEELSGRGDLKVYLIDFENGFVWSKLKENKNVFLIDYNSTVKVKLPENSTLVIFPSYFDKIKQLIEPSTKANLIVWFIQPYLLINLPKFKNSVRLFMPVRVNKIRALLNALNAREALLFMDEENFKVNKEYFKLNFEPDYLPIPTIIKSIPFVKKKKVDFNIAWIGRVSNEKVESIKYLLNDIFTFNNKSETKIKFHVIGEGHAMDELKKELIRGKVTEVIFKGVLIGDELEQYLLNEIDCVFAMGTSALDMASYKIPTIVLDYASHSFSKLNYTYKYKWLFDTKGFMLGQDINDSVSTNQLTLEDVVNQVKEDESNKIGDRCFEYVYNNHNVQSVASMLVNKANKSTFLFNENYTYNINHTVVINKLLFLKKKMDVFLSKL
jgi:hypothetical protein